MTENLINRFLNYVAIDTQSSEESTTSPSTMKQHDLAGLLVSELVELGAEDVVYDRDHCNVYAKLKGEGEPLGFVSHMDTSPAASGANVKPRFIENFQGDDPFLREDQFPELALHHGETLIATDGTTLLGADDKAGVAEIMNMLQYYSEHPEIRHRTISVAFTSDEEIGQGTLHFDTDQFGAAEAYTVDGGKLGVVEYECFNAASAEVKIKGRSVHPGDAKDKMINAIYVAMEFNGFLPAIERPEHTTMYEGFFMLSTMEGGVDEARMKYIIRDHDRGLFEMRKGLFARIATFLNEKYGEGTITLDIRDTYYNMAEVMKDHMDMIERVKEKFAKLGVNCVTMPIRGGTDGAALSFKGIPCPNLCTGGYNFHGRYEFASVQEMEKCAELLISLVKIDD